MAASSRPEASWRWSASAAWRPRRLCVLLALSAAWGRSPRSDAFASPACNALPRRAFAGGRWREVDGRGASGLRAGEGEKLDYFSDGGYGSLRPASLGPQQKGAGLQLEADWAWATRGFSLWAVFQAAAAVEIFLLSKGKAADPTVAPIIVTAACCSVLHSAATRDRLGGGTFRLLSLGLLAASGLLLLRAMTNFSLLLTAMSKRPIPLAVEALLIAQVPIAFMAWSGCKAAYSTLAQYGLPKFKMTVQAEKGRRWLLSLLAVGYFVTSVQQVYSGSLALFHGLPTMGSLRCFVVAACAHVCQTAAVAGPKRLSSETYRTLNLALLLDAGSRLAMLVATASKPPALIAGVLVFPAVDAFCALGGWLVGKYYKA